MSLINIKKGGQSSCDKSVIRLFFVKAKGNDGVHDTYMHMPKEKQVSFSVCVSKNVVFWSIILCFCVRYFLISFLRFLRTYEDKTTIPISLSIDSATS